MVARLQRRTDKVAQTPERHYAQQQRDTRQILPRLGTAQLVQ